MSSPDRLLATQNSQAAIGRFFYNLLPEPVGDVVADSQCFSQEFFERYRDYLKYPLSLVVSKTLSEKPLTNLDVAFDTSRARQGIFGWQLNVIVPAATLTASTHGRALFAFYCSPSEAVAGVREYDAQARLHSSLLLKDGDRLLLPKSLWPIVRTVVKAQEVDAQAREMDVSRAVMALRIVKLLAGSPADIKSAEAMKKQLADIVFKPAHFRFGLGMDRISSQEVATMSE